MGGTRLHFPPPESTFHTKGKGALVKSFPFYRRGDRGPEQEEPPRVTCEFNGTLNLGCLLPPEAELEPGQDE